MEVQAGGGGGHTVCTVPRGGPSGSVELRGIELQDIEQQRTRRNIEIYVITRCEPATAVRAQSAVASVLDAKQFLGALAGFEARRSEWGRDVRRREAASGWVSILSSPEVFNAGVKKHISPQKAPRNMRTALQMQKGRGYDELVGATAQHLQSPAVYCDGYRRTQAAPSGSGAGRARGGAAMEEMTYESEWEQARESKWERGCTFAIATGEDEYLPPWRRQQLEKARERKRLRLEDWFLAVQLLLGWDDQKTTSAQEMEKALSEFLDGEARSKHHVTPRR
ncbi:unnamed protein product, partial [Prorocentrum cordatum]